MDQSTMKYRVDLIWTKLGPKGLCLGFTIQVKVLGQLKLERKDCLVIDNMHSKGKIDLRSILIFELFYLQLY